MSVTSGFFNSQSGDRKYNAEHFGSIFAGIIKDGVFANYPNTGDELKVTAVSGAMQVQVGPGRCWFNNTWLNNDSNLVFNVPTADSNQARVDAVVVDINLTNDVRQNSIIYKTGQVGGGNPSLINSNGHYQYVLAYVQVPAGATAPTVVGQVGVNKPTPYITGPLQTVSADNVLAQWNNAVNNKIETELAEYLADDGSKLYEKIETEADRVMPLIVAFIMTNQGVLMSSHDGNADEIRTALHENKPVYGFLQYPDKNDPTVYDPEYFSTVDVRETSNGMGGKSTIEFYFLDRNDPFNVIVCGYDGVAEDTPYTLVREIGGSGSENLVATFSSTPASCDVSYADLSAAIQAKQPITAVYQYRIGTRTHTAYASHIGMQTYAIGIEFRLPSETVKFEYMSSGMTFSIEYDENKSAYAFEFIGGPSDPGTNGEFSEILSAYNNDRPIIAKMEDTNGTMRVTSTYEVASDSSSVTFYFVSIVPTSSTSPSSWTYKCIAYRLMQDGTVIYSGN